MYNFKTLNKTIITENDEVALAHGAQAGDVIYQPQPGADMTNDEFAAAVQVECGLMPTPVPASDRFSVRFQNGQELIVSKDGQIARLR